MITTTTEALEGRAAYTGDIKGSFLHASQKYFTVIKFVNEEVEILCLMGKNHEQHVDREGKNSVTCMMLNQALYGTLTGSMLWCKLLTGTLIKN